MSQATRRRTVSTVLGGSLPPPPNCRAGINHSDARRIRLRPRVPAAHGGLFCLTRRSCGYAHRSASRSGVFCRWACVLSRRTGGGEDDTDCSVRLPTGPGSQLVGPFGQTVSLRVSSPNCGPGQRPAGAVRSRRSSRYPGGGRRRRLMERHGQAMNKNSAFHLSCAFRISSTTSRTAPRPPGRVVT